VSHLTTDAKPGLAPEPEPQWLTGEEQEAWRAVAALMLLLPGPLDGQLQRDSGISLFEYLVLSSISMAPGRTLRMSEIARVANGSLSRLSNVVKRLEQQGWVRRESDACDGRYTVATLTDSGMERVVAAAPGHVETVRHYVIEPLTTAQLRALAAAGVRIRARLESRSTTAPCDPGDAC
jgi:DNA-binding MarR family transcriptional regulator